MLKNVFSFISKFPRNSLILLIKVYQNTLSLDHGPIGKYIFPHSRFCIYSPSCSTYSIEAIKKYGVLKGGYLATKRIISCNPFSKGGYDPLP